MLSYVNGFSASVNENKNEIMIFFKQRSPVIGDDGSLDSTVSEDVAKIVMNKEGFLALRQLLNNFVIE